MANPQLHPLQVNKRTGEPYLRLPSPNDNIIITPPRLPDDIPPSVALLNDPKIYPWMGSLKHHPYLPEHAEASLTKVKRRSDRVLRELAEAADEVNLRIVDVCPIGCIRDELEDGSDVYIGDIGFSRCTWPEVTDSEERERLIADNEAKKAGDPEIIWQIGDYLAPSHHRRGIMSAALALILHQWAIPRMGVHHILANSFTVNQGSVGVFKKNGFAPAGTVKNFSNVVGEKGIVQRLEWTLKPVE